MLRRELINDSKWDGDTDVDAAKKGDFLSQ